MTTDHDGSGKRERLRQAGLLNRKAEQVTDPIFRECGFFDPDDLLQVRYEMVRAARSQSMDAAEAARRFGFSAQTCTRYADAFDRGGMPALLPGKRGPRGPHKITPAILHFVLSYRERYGRVGSRRLAPMIEAKFGIKLHPRAIDKALERRQKKSVAP